MVNNDLDDPRLRQSPRLTLTGVTRVEVLLNQFPRVIAPQGAMISNGATGTADIDLCGLGPKRTLVLVHGLRPGPGDPGTGGASRA